MSDNQLIGDELPFPVPAQQILMRSAIAAGAAGRRLAVDRRGVFHLTPREWAQLEGTAADVLAPPASELSSGKE